MASLKSKDIFTKKLIIKIRESAHSRIPVYDKEKKSVIGILFAKDLVGVDTDQRIPITHIMRKLVVHVHENDRLDNALNMFRKKRIHLFIVLNKEHHIKGIITLEDVLEEIVGDIVDEHDTSSDVTKIEKKD